jgi:hypothetical protein
LFVDTSMRLDRMDRSLEIVDDDASSLERALCAAA